MTAISIASAQVLVTHSVGLHARPSVKFTKLAKTFACTIEAATALDGPWADAKSIVKIMAMRAPAGTVLHLRASGDQAKEAVEALRALVERNFDEEGAHAGTA